jgi:putative DNA primase/helicase
MTGPETERRADENEFPEALILDPSDPLSIARSFLNWNFEVGGIRTLHHHQGAFYAYGAAFYHKLDQQEVRSKLYDFLDHAVVRLLIKSKREEGLMPFKPNKRDVDNIMDALKAETNLSAEQSPPVWLQDNEEFPGVREILICRNGLLRLPTRELYPATPQLFATRALPVCFDPKAPKPARWLSFLSELWPDDQACIDTLQEWFGYLLTDDTRQQKIVLVVGPRRSGKGTIGRTIKGLIGESGHCGPTLASLSHQFGLATLIGKSVAVVPDARLRKSDTAEIAERLLSLSGEDTLSIDRKHLPAWTGKLSVRVTILTNELPSIADASGALAGRFLVLRLTKSYFGKEDPNLSDDLAREFPGILIWALEGWDRLQKRGYFIQPPSAEDLIRQLEELGSPVLAFIHERCERGPGYSVRVDFLYKAWKDWCDANEHHHGDVQSFGRDLAAAVPGVKVTQPRVDGKQVRVYQGIRLRPDTR